jgi:hypothetical protein
MHRIRGLSTEYLLLNTRWNRGCDAVNGRQDEVVWVDSGWERWTMHGMIYLNKVCKMDFEAVGRLLDAGRERPQDRTARGLLATITFRTRSTCFGKFSSQLSPAQPSPIMKCRATRATWPLLETPMKTNRPVENSTIGFGNLQGHILALYVAGAHRLVRPSGARV